MNILKHIDSAKAKPSIAFPNFFITFYPPYVMTSLLISYHFCLYKKYFLHKKKTLNI